ncbi:MAG: transketolase [Anaerolineae bacterium]
MTHTNNSNLPQLSANTIRFLAADAVQAANSGHPGMPMGMADAAIVLYKNFMRHNPTDTSWANRDRFILSAGHGSMLLYSLLHLTGYSLSLDEIKNFRQWGSKTPGHPENTHTDGIETTTGPLGAGISNSVGFALAEAWLAGKYNKPGFDVVDHHTYVICSDGDLQEGISHEACALAGHLGLGKLIVLWDDNGIQIDGSTDLAFGEDVLKRFEAYGWDTNRVDGHDMSAVDAAISAAKGVTDKPTIISCKTIIGKGSPNKQGTASSHGSPLGEDEIKLTKEGMGWPVDEKFLVPGEVREYMDATASGQEAQSAWATMFAEYAEEHPAEAAAFTAEMAGDLPDNWEDALKVFGPDDKMATRAASGKVLAGLVPAIPAMLGGSADLTGSNKTDVDIKNTGYVANGDITGRYVYYGVREHGMAAIMNGMALHGGVIPYGGTFHVFSDYMRGAMRLSAVIQERVIYVLTHDSIGLGEDGPTHQPVEHHMSLRAIPNLWMIRPADPNETAQAWKTALARTDGPTAIVLTRQGLPVIESGLAANAAKGAYVVAGSDNDAALILATGSEVEIALAGRDLLAAEGISARVVSMPCWELFDLQSTEYKESVIPSTITNRTSIEAGITMGWQKFTGLNGVNVGLDHFGGSAPFEVLYEKFGITAQAVAEGVKSQI